jgi:hypothetical protein
MVDPLFIIGPLIILGVIAIDLLIVKGLAIRKAIIESEILITLLSRAAFILLFTLPWIYNQFSDFIVVLIISGFVIIISLFISVKSHYFFKPTLGKIIFIVLILSTASLLNYITNPQIIDGNMVLTGCSSTYCMIGNNFANFIAPGFDFSFAILSLPVNLCYLILIYLFICLFFVAFRTMLNERPIGLFFFPTIIKIALFVILMACAFRVLHVTAIFPCHIDYIRMNTSQASLCAPPYFGIMYSLIPKYSNVQLVYPWTSWLWYGFLLVMPAYLLSCLLSYLFRK